MKKYEITDIGMEWEGRKVYRIRALKSFGIIKKGDLGGFVQNERNLSQEGDCWVSDDAVVCDHAKIYDHAKVFGEARITDYAHLNDMSCVCGNAFVGGTVSLYDRCTVCDNAFVKGLFVIRNSTCIGKYASVLYDVDFFTIDGVGSRCESTTFYRGYNDKIYVSCGCFNNTIDKFEKAVHKTHKGTFYEKQYNAAIELARVHFKHVLTKEFRQGIV